MDSYLHGTSATPLLGETIGANLRRTVERFGEREALVVRSQGYRATYRELWEEATVLARALLASGVQKGDRVGIWSPNRFEWVITQFAAARIGAILVNINPAYKTSELQYALTQSGVSLLIHAAAFRSSDYSAMVREVCDRCPDLREAVVIDTGWRALLGRAQGASEGELAERESALQFDDAINIQYTSGTTGSPKGATLSHHNILNNGYLVGEMIRLHGAGPRLHSGAVLSLLRHGDGQPRLQLTRRMHGRSGGGVRSVGDARDDCSRTVYVALRRADDVHRAALASTIRRIRSVVAADRHHGRLAVPGGSDETGPVVDAHARGHDLLWHDGNLARVDAEQLG